jgi:hypothetical protein
MQRLVWFFWKVVGRVTSKHLENLAASILSALPAVAFHSHHPIVWPARDCFLSRPLFETNRTPSRDTALLCFSRRRALRLRHRPALLSLLFYQLFVLGTGCKKGSIVNKFALAAALALMVGSAAQAKLIELVPEAPGASPQARVVAPGPADRLRTVPPPSMSELPEPEVFAMMLVGLVLLGFRARRDSSEKFE